MVGTAGRGGPQWDPEEYGRYAGERGRPFQDLVARVGAEQPRDVVDLGCGPATLTATLCQRWPAARVLGVDSSAEMLARAEDARRGGAGDRLRLERADAWDWARAHDVPGGAVDVVVANALLQWVPRQLQLLPVLLGVLRPGGWLAVQVPGNHDAASHVLLREVAGREPYAQHTTEARRREPLPGPGDYLDTLLRAGATAPDVWETTYLHLLTGADPVLRWMTGTGARPVLQALPEQLREPFLADYGAALRAAYPPGPHGTVLPFRRVFAVARRPVAG